MTLETMALQRMQGHWAAVEKSAVRILAIAPFNEEATLALAEAHAMRGSKLEGQRILDAYLLEVGDSSTDLRVPATIMRRRIGGRFPQTAQMIPGDTPLVGRSLAMLALSKSLINVTSGEGKCCLVFGEAGIGKSRLMSEFLMFSSLQGVTTQRVQCRSSDPRRPLSVFVDLVPLLQNLRGAIGCSPETLKYLERLTRHRVGDNSINSSEGDSQFIYAGIEKALFDLIEAVSDEKPMVLLFEDVHWIDDVSQKILSHLIEWCDGRPVIIALTSRSRPIWLTAREDQTEIALPPLDAEASSQLVVGIARQHETAIDSSYVDWCVQVAEGNPFFLEELAKQWLESGSVHAAPPSLTSVLEQRISRLDLDSLQLLQTCVLLENNATFDRIEKILGYEPHRLLNATNTLASAGMLTSRRGESENNTVFILLPRHELLGIACLQRLAEQARAFLHRRVAIVLEDEVIDSASSAILWNCAKHWQQAGDSSRALSLARSCGLHLIEMGLPTAASEAFDKAYVYCTTSVDRLSILTDQAKAYEQSSAWTAIDKVASAARSILNRIEPSRGHHDELELRALRAHWKTGHTEDTLAKVLECLRCEDATPDHRVKAGGIVLMLQDVLGLQERMPAVYCQIEQLSANAGVSVAAKLE
ncbi:MAG: AAA family ATPase, partial [Gemmatimonadales bacterium]